ncbi:MAG: nucleotidyltransferase domain-containing protein [Methanosarcinaceae archaeon]|nr:nucleotidyltransferase domain-containing protein [Methanosarcinaceae archaeon]
MSNNTTHSESNMLEKMQTAFLSHDEIVAAYLFGSYANDNTRSDSDIDIGLLLSDNSNVGAMYSVHIAKELEDAADTKREMDVRILNNGTLRFLHQVLKGRLLFCRDDKKRIDFETSTIDRYLDFKPFLDDYDRMRKERLMHVG